MYEYLLPIGSVVKLKNADKYIMIFGVLQKNIAENNEVNEIDYIGVPYPGGFIGSNVTIGFNHDSIAEIAFKGFENGDGWKNFTKALEYADKINEARNKMLDEEAK